MKVIVAYSGGKDSQASLIWAVQKYGVENVEAVFCDTGWENPVTYQHIIDSTKQLGVKLTIAKSTKYAGMVDLAIQKKRFASTRARFCTYKLKGEPMVDFVLSQKEHLLIIQGIRKSESRARSMMNEQCRYFKYYFEPYNIDPRTGKLKLDKDGKQQKEKYYNYRKKEVKEWVKQFSDDILRPVFNWSAQEVIDYIVANGMSPNPLYSQGFIRVGCFPCFMSQQIEVFHLMKFYPERMKYLKEVEQRVGSSFFKPDYIPAKYRTGTTKFGKKYSTAEDIEKYLNAKNGSLDLFDEEGPSCMSFYNLCE